MTSIKNSSELLHLSLILDGIEKSDLESPVEPTIDIDTHRIHNMLGELVEGKWSNLLDVLRERQSGIMDNKIAWKDMLLLGEFDIDGERTGLYINSTIRLNDRSLALTTPSSEAGVFRSVRNYIHLGNTSTKELSQKAPTGLFEGSTHAFCAAEDQSHIVSVAQTADRSPRFVPIKNGETLELIIQRNHITSDMFKNQLQIQLGLLNEVPKTK